MSGEFGLIAGSGMSDRWYSYHMETLLAAECIPFIFERRCRSKKDNWHQGRDRDIEEESELFVHRAT